MNHENFTERNERLGATSPRLTAIADVLSALETPAVDVDGEFEALHMLLDDARADGDTHGLKLLGEGLRRLYVLWSVSLDDPRLVEHRGELRGALRTASVALERLIPLEVLAEIEPESLLHQILTFVVENEGASNEQLVAELHADKTQISRAGRRLHDAGLARKRRLGRRNSWEITPRGLQALDALQQGGATRPIGHQPQMA